jgi:AraC family transcriptional regulator of adaptative response/methylated-DNA-[protein]-cysteine methyltransferase
MTHYEQIALAIKHVVKRYREQPSLEELAKEACLSPFHFQRIFTEWAGVSPKQFVGYLTVEALKKEILQSRNLIEASGKVGLSAQSRAYDLTVNIEAITPGEYKSSGKGVVMEYGSAATPFGECFVATTPRGVCSLQFIRDDREKIIAEHCAEWHSAKHVENNSVAQYVVDTIFTDRSRPLNLFLKGTPFQLKVWQALLLIPFGNIASYQEVAELIHQGSAVRAVASAVARNPVSLIIPCHRVIRSEGVIGQYHWGSGRKACIIGWERARRENMLWNT